jgi:alkylation response protein AidB-like acyl-CoA dehydrogenase
MDFSFTQDQESLRELAAKLFGDFADPVSLKEAEAAGFFHEELWHELAKSELLGAAFPLELGGSGLGLVELCLLLVAQGRHAVPVPLWPTLFLGALPIAHFGPRALAARVLPEVAAGRLLLTGALSEIGEGDPASPATHAEPDGEGWRIEGEKIAVPAAHLARGILVPARTGGGLTVFFVESGAPGLTRQTQVTTTGEPLGLLRFQGVRVGRGDVVGEPGGGCAVVDWMIDRATVGLCALELGVAERQLEMTAAYTTQRKQFERPIATFQAVGQRAAEAYIDVLAIRLSLWQAAWRLEAGVPAVKEVAIAKYWACEAGQRVANAAQHLHGGIGFDRAYPLYRYFLWAKELELTLGAASQQLARLGAELAREEGDPT